MSNHKRYSATMSPSTSTFHTNLEEAVDDYLQDNKVPAHGIITLFSSEALPARVDEYLLNIEQAVLEKLNENAEEDEDYQEGTGFFPTLTEPQCKEFSNKLKEVIENFFRQNNLHPNWSHIAKVQPIHVRINGLNAYDQSYEAVEILNADAVIEND